MTLEKSVYTVFYIFTEDKRSYHPVLILSTEVLFLRCFLKSGWLGSERTCLGALQSKMYHAALTTVTLFVKVMLFYYYQKGSVQEVTLAL